MVMKRIALFLFMGMLILTLCFAVSCAVAADSAYPYIAVSVPPLVVPAGSLYTPPVVNVPTIEIVVPTPFVPKLQPVPTPIAPIIDLADLIQKQGVVTDLNWPDNGEIYRKPGDQRNTLELTIKIESCAAGSASYAKIYEGNTLVSGLFIGGVGEVTASLGSGVYQIKLGTGVTWLNTEDAFGSAGRYQTLLFDNDSDHVLLLEGRAYTLTINTDTLDPEAQGVGSQEESWEGF